MNHDHIGCENHMVLDRTEPSDWQSDQRHAEGEADARISNTPTGAPMSDMEQFLADLRTADGIKRQLRGELSEAMRRELEDLLYAAGRIDGLREATDRIAIQGAA